MAFDFTPSFTHGNLSRNGNFTNSEFVEALNDEYNNNTDEWNERLLDPFKPTNISLGLWPAAITFGSWLAAQPTVGDECTSPGCSRDNPFSPPFSKQQKKNFLSQLGPSIVYPGCNPEDLLNNYNSNRGKLGAIENTYYNFAEPEKSFTWENNCLCMNDRYNFEGISDFGGATAATVIAGIIAAPVGTAVVIVSNLLNALTPDYDRQTDPFTIWRRGDAEIARARPIYLKSCFCADEEDDDGNPILCKSNEPLYRCAIKSGKIEASPSNACFNGDSCIEVGQAQPSPILGFPSYAPNVMEITTDEGSLSFGGSGGYPSPFTSFLQQIVNANNSLGAYAMFGDISGRLIVIPSGAYSGELGFTCQSWYDFNDGTHARDSNGNLYPTKAQWWETCLKSEMNVRFLPLASRPLVKVMVATKSFSDNNSSEVFSADYPIVAAPIASISLTSILAALPAATLTLL